VLERTRRFPFSPQAPPLIRVADNTLHAFHRFHRLIPCVESLLSREKPDIAACW
jgi:hypothetical protein